MDRYLLRYFLAIVETGNFSRAAARENVAQPTLSAGIAKLEGQLQARLFDRTNRRVHLTQAGSRFLVHARRIEHEFNLAQASVSGAAQSELLRVAVRSTIPASSASVALYRRPVSIASRAVAADSRWVISGSRSSPAFSRPSIFLQVVNISRP